MRCMSKFGHQAILGIKRPWTSFCLQPIQSYEINVRDETGLYVIKFKEKSNRSKKTRYFEICDIYLIDKTRFSLYL